MAKVVLSRTLYASTTDKLILEQLAPVHRITVLGFLSHFTHSLPYTNTEAASSLPARKISKLIIQLS